MNRANLDEVICPNCVTQFRAIPINVQSELRAQAATIDRLENEAVAATVRIENDGRLIQKSLDEVERTTTLARGYLAELVSTRMKRDAYQQAADTMAASHEVERDAMFLDLTRTRQDLSGALMEIAAIRHWKAMMEAAKP